MQALLALARAPLAWLGVGALAMTVKIFERLWAPKAPKALACEKADPSATAADDLTPSTQAGLTPTSQGDLSPKPEAPLSADEIALIQKTWAIVQTLPTATVGILLFKNIFRQAGDAAPAVAKLFSFGRKEGFSLDDLDACEGLPSHATLVVNTVSVAVSKLNQLEELVPVLRQLGSVHQPYGVVEAHYPVVGGALLATLEQGLPKENWTPEAKEAFTKMWGVVASTMQSGYAS